MNVISINYLIVLSIDEIYGTVPIYILMIIAVKFSDGNDGRHFR